MPIITKPWTRRRFLQAAGLSSTAAALLPFVPSLRASAQEVGTPKRLVLFTSTNGTNLALWRDNGAGAAFRTQVGTAAIPALRGTILSPLDLSLIHI